jgi:hypothetical protein
MTDNVQTTGNSPVIPERRSEGITGPSREVSKRDQIMPGAGGAGQENEELTWARRHMPKGSTAETAKEVFRKTELHNSPPSEEDEMEKLRQQMMQRLRRQNCEVSYQQYETSFRHFISTLMVRQDRTDAELREQVAALCEQIGVLQERLERKTGRLEYRVDDLEERGRS